MCIKVFSGVGATFMQGALIRRNMVHLLLLTFGTQLIVNWTVAWVPRKDFLLKGWSGLSNRAIKGHHVF